MAAIAWPPTLPQDHLIQSNFTRQPATIYSSTGAGTTKTRRRFTSASYSYSDRLVFTQAQLNTFDVFFVTTLDEGSRVFEWQDPRNQNTVDQIILGYPEFTQQSPDIWVGIANFEIVPA